MNFQTVAFEAAAGRADQLPRSDLPEVVFSGKSNVGKSSLLNKLVNRKAIARVSATPGKTATINFYNLDTAWLVDLPGYGYAKVSKAEKDRWGKLMEAYFASGLIDYGVMIVDARHKPTANDMTMAEWFKNSGKPFVIVANKLDKLRKRDIEPNLALIRQTLELPETVEIIAFSAEKGDGRDALVGILQSVAGDA